MLSNLGLNIISGLVSHPAFVVGYAAAVVCPIPFLNSSILKVWHSIGAGVKSKFEAVVKKYA